MYANILLYILLYICIYVHHGAKEPGDQQALGGVQQNKEEHQPGHAPVSPHGTLQPTQGVSDTLLGFRV